MNPTDFPKLESPFEREIQNDKYIVVPKMNKEYEWIFSEDCIATDKLDGTNVSIIIEKNCIKEIYNRKNLINIWKDKNWFYNGLKNAIEKNMLKLKEIKDGQYFGELIGPKINGNPYNLTEALWIPFEYLRENYKYKFWDTFAKENKNKTEKEKFDVISETFKGLWSIYKRQRRIKTEVNANTVFEGTMAAEGIVFYNKKSGEMCKLRRDMFDWYKGKSHG